MNPLEILREQPFVLAPMAGITDSAFRSFMKEMGCPIVVTELISANGLEYASQRTRDLMKFEKIQSPLGVQLFGETPEIIAKGAKYAQDIGADFVDLNFGCPVPKVVKKGAGAAVLKDLKQMAEILSTVRKAVSIPLTIKIRTGWDENTRNAHEVLHLASEEGIDWVAIHGRTRSQGYAGWSDWEYIAEVKGRAKIPVLGNGDIQTADEAIQRLETTRVDGVLIGRGALKNPWIFLEAVEIWKRKAAGNESTRIHIQKDLNHIMERLQHHVYRQHPEERALLHIKKFSAWFSTGYPGAAQFRKNVFQSRSAEQVRDFIHEFYSAIKSMDQQSTRNEAFLMGGHG